MKYIVTFAIITLPFVSLAQCPSNKGQFDIALSYGLITSDQVAQQFSATDNTSPSGNSKTITYNSGAMFVTVRYFLFNRLAFGFSGGNTSERGQNADRTNPSLIASIYQQNATTIAMELYYIYTFRKYLEVYTILGAGPSFTTTTTTANTAATISAVTKNDKIKAQYTPIGIRLGGRLGAFAELGIGYKGVANLGISYKFGQQCWWKYH